MWVPLSTLSNTQSCWSTCQNHSVLVAWRMLGHTYSVVAFHSLRLDRYRECVSPLRRAVGFGPGIHYMADVSRLVEEFRLGVHLYADDVQLYVWGKSSITVDLVNRTMHAIGVIQTWMSSNRLCLNPDKTQIIWLGTSQQLTKSDVQHLPMIHTPSHSVSNLGLRVNWELTFHDYVSKLCQQSFFHLRRLRPVRNSLTPYSLVTLVNSFVSNRLDYCKTVCCLAQAH